MACWLARPPRRRSARISPTSCGKALELHRTAHTFAFHGADPRQQGHRATPRGFAALRSGIRQGGQDHSGRPDPRRAKKGLSGGQFQPGRRHKRYVGSRGLSKHAGKNCQRLYWMFRYIERAENIARLVDAGLRVSLTRTGSTDEDWDGVLQSAGVRDEYVELHGKVTTADAIDYLLREKANPSSVMSCIDSGRNNARMVRTALTRETWKPRTSAGSNSSSFWKSGLSLRICRGLSIRSSAAQASFAALSTVPCCAMISITFRALAPLSSGPTIPAVFWT